jgi:hypothetical protein
MPGTGRARACIGFCFRDALATGRPQRNQAGEHHDGISGKGDWSMKAALTSWVHWIGLLCLPLVAVVGCDEGEHGENFNVDAILAIIYAVGDVVLSIIEATT